MRRTIDEQLRLVAADLRGDDPNAHHRRNVNANVVDEAADEIERLRIENADLKRAWQRERDRYDVLFDRTAQQ